MIQNAPILREQPVARPRLLKRSALFASGAVTGMVVSVVASYAVVSAFVPVAGPSAKAPGGVQLASLGPVPEAAPAVQAPRPGPAATASAVAPAPGQVRVLPAPAEVSAVAPATRSPAAMVPGVEVPSPLPAARDLTLARAPASAVPPAVEPPAAPETAPALAGTSAPAQAAPPAEEPSVPVVVVEGAPDVVPPARPGSLEARIAAAQLGLPMRAATHPQARPGDNTSPDAFATLAEADATGRAGATLGYAGAVRPAPRPETDVTLASAAPETAADSAAAVDAAVRDAAAEAALAPAGTEPAVVASADAAATIRPRPRPADLVPATYDVAAAAVVPEPIPAVHPKPRPDVLRVAAAAPSAAPAPKAEPEAAAPAPRTRVASGGTCGRSLVRAIPHRRSGAPTGSQFFANLAGLSGTERDNVVLAELSRGNVPSFLRHLYPVRFAGQDSRGKATEIVICVAPDYLALGSDRDFVRTPLGLPAASRIAGAFDMVLPTPRMVDAIYAQADVHLSPAPMQAGPQMTSTAYLLRHNATIQQQLHGRGGLVAGDKKDVVMASRLGHAPGRVAIYGWHRSLHSPIQPVSTVHQASYADYSHGIRLVSRTAYLNGRAVDIDDLLTSSRYAYLLNSDGPLTGRVIRIASR